MIDEELPYPPISGKRIRTLNLHRAPRQRHRVTYVCHRNADARRGRARADDALRATSASAPSSSIAPCRRKSGPRFYARLAAQPALAAAVLRRHATPAGRCARRSRSVAAEDAVDLWHCRVDALRPGAARPAAAGACVMAHNVESVIWQRYHETERNPLKRWYIGRQWRKFARFERRALDAADLTIAVSDAGRRALPRRVRRRPPSDVVENGVDTAYFRPQRRDPRAGHAAVPRQPGLAAEPRRRRAAARARLPRGAAAGAATPRLLLVGRNPPDVAAERVPRDAGRRAARRRAGRAAVPGAGGHAGRAAAHRRRLAAEDPRSAGERHAGRLDARRGRGAATSSRAAHFARCEDVDDLAGGARRG